MIQSDKFDSFMSFKNNIDKIRIFLFRRLLEIIGFLILISGIMLSVSLLSYSPSDPNFLYSSGQMIENKLGIYGSIISDFLLQSFGLTSYLLPFTLLAISIKVAKDKVLSPIINNLFYVVCYCITFTTLLSQFFLDTNYLIVNGNGGFVGNYLYNDVLFKPLNYNNQVSYYFLITSTFVYIKVRQFKLPKLDLLDNTKKIKQDKNTRQDINEEFLEKILLDFGVEGKIKKISSGPVVTLNEFEPAAGVKVSKIVNLSEDIARNTSSESARISIIPGSSSVGIEIPNLVRENVLLREILSSPKFNAKDIKLPIALGKNISGEPIIGDLSSMPHLLIAGTTGSGKSVCINTILLSLLYKHPPSLCKFILIDPKMLELSTYEGIPHLLCPVITEAKKARDLA